jgi:hypothetical protein
VTGLEGKCGLALEPSRGDNRSVLAFSDRGKSSNEVWDDADRSGVTFNLPPGNASLSMSPDARYACATPLLILLACPPTQIDNTPRPCPMLVGCCDYEVWPHESMEMPFRAYAWLERGGDENRLAVHQDLA